VQGPDFWPTPSTHTHTTFSKSTLCNFTAFIGLQIQIYFGRASGYYYTALTNKLKKIKGLKMERGKDCGESKKYSECSEDRQRKKRHTMMNLKLWKTDKDRNYLMLDLNKRS
jgi:hypothetical protein